MQGESCGRAQLITQQSRNLHIYPMQADQRLLTTLMVVLGTLAFMSLVV